MLSRTRAEFNTNNDMLFYYKSFLLNHYKLTQVLVIRELSLEIGTIIPNRDSYYKCPKNTIFIRSFLLYWSQFAHSYKESFVTIKIHIAFPGIISLKVTNSKQCKQTKYTKNS